MDNVPDDFDLNFPYEWEPTGIRTSGINQEAELVGAAAVESTLAKLHRGDYGIAKHPKMIAIEGTWVKGTTLLPFKEFKGTKNG